MRISCVLFVIPVEALSDLHSSELQKQQTAPKHLRLQPGFTSTYIHTQTGQSFYCACHCQDPEGGE